MAFSSGDGNGPMAEINIIPLADVMLVLLIIFMVTALKTQYPIDIDLPQKSITPPPEVLNPPDPIKLRIDAAGQVFWNDNPVPMSALRSMMDAEVERDPGNQPVLQINANDDSDYGILAKVLATARNAQMQKIGFVKE